MAQIHFKGKTYVRNHHLSVPHRPLQPDAKKSVSGKGEPRLDGNLIIHGDNLHALKALLPMYGGKVNCIYIDPPYNTSNEKWCYNDNVNSPQMQAWLRENPITIEDNLRHDKWCAMMWPRLVLLHDLLAEDGVIFVSIDDNEQHRLRMMMDEIFGEEAKIANIIVKSNPGGRDYGGIAQTHDYVLCYGKTSDAELNLIPKENDFPHFDEIGGFEPRELRNRNKTFNSENRPNLFYPFFVNPKKLDSNGLCPVSADPVDGWVKVYPSKSQGVQTVWRWQKDTARENLHNLSGKKTNKGHFQIVEKYRSAFKRERSILDDKCYRTEEGSLVLKEIFTGASSFPYPKSFSLLKRLITLGADKNGIILDSFAGSGTTAHATLALNKADGGNRKFVLVECEDYANKVTAERTRRVIKGVSSATDAILKSGLGGQFTYCTLGKSVDAEKILSFKEMPTYKDLAALLFHTATMEAITLSKINEKSNYIGESPNYHIWLIYKPNADFLRSPDAAFTLKFAKEIVKLKKVKSDI